MRLLALLAVSLISFDALAQSEFAPKPTSTALGALKLVPEGQAAQLVGIYAREGVPAPDRWYFVTFDAAEETGVREFVVSGNKLVATRGLSQFAQSLKPADVLEKREVRIDSDKAGQIALDYGRANSLSIETINYELRQEGTTVAPYWKLACLNESARRVGELKISADDGGVISHEGFPIEPTRAQPTQPSQPTAPQPKIVHPSPTPDPTPRNRTLVPLKAIGGKLKNFFSGH